MDELKEQFTSEYLKEYLIEYLKENDINDSDLQEAINSCQNAKILIDAIQVSGERGVLNIDKIKNVLKKS